MHSTPTLLDLAVHNAPRVSGVYALRNKRSGKCYIGQAVNIGARLGTHLRHLRAGTHPSPALRAAFAKYDESEWLFEVVELCERELLTSRESHWAAITGALKIGYNTAPIQSGVEVTDSFRDIARSAALKYHARVTDQARTRSAAKAAATKRMRKAAAEASSASGASAAYPQTPADCLFPTS